MARIVFNVENADAKKKVKDLAGAFGEIDKAAKASVTSLGTLGKSVDDFTAKTQKLDNIRIAMAGLADQSKKVTFSFRDDLQKSAAAAGKTASRVEDITEKVEGLSSRLGVLDQMRTRMEGVQGSTTKVNEKLKELGAGLRSTERSSRRTKDAMDGAFGTQVVGRLQGMVGAFLSINTAIQAIRSEYAAIQEVTGKIVEGRLTGEAAMDVLRRNLFALEADDPGMMARTVQRVREEASAMGISEDQMMRTVAAGFSAISGATQEEILEKTFAYSRAAMPFIRTLSPEERAKTVGALGDIAGVLNLEDLSHEEQALAGLGYMTNVLAVSRPEQFRQVQQNLGKVVQAMSLRGVEAGYAGALFAAITTGATDPEARITATGEIGLRDNVRDFFRDIDPQGRGKLELQDQIQALIDNRELALQFLEHPGVSFQQKFLPGLEALLLDPDSPARKQFNLALGMGMQADELVRTGRMGLAGMEGDPLTRQGNIARATEQAEQEALRSDPRIYVEGAIRERFLNLMRQSARSRGDIAKGAEWQAWVAGIGGLGADEAVNLLQAEITGLQNQFVGTTDIRREPTANQQQLISNMQNLIRHLEANYGPVPPGRQE